MSHSYGSRRTDESTDTRGDVDTRNDRPTVERREPNRERVATPDHRTVVARQRDEYGGVKIGSAFFGWLTAMGMAVLLTALLAAAGAAVGVATGTDVGEAGDAASSQTDTVGLVGGIALLVVVFVAYFCGGYVAGR